MNTEPEYQNFLAVQHAAALSAPRRAMLDTAIASKWRVLACVVAALLAASIYLRSATYFYAAELKVTPNQVEGGGLPSSLSNIAAIAGVSVPRGQTSTFSLYQELLKSREVATVLSHDEGVMRRVFRDEWGGVPKGGRPQPPSGGLRPLIDTAKLTLGVPSYAWHEPGPAELEKYIDDMVSVSENPKRGITTIAFQHPDPGFAKAFLRRLHDTADQLIRDRTQRRTSAFIAYLDAKLATVTLAEHRQSLVTALAEQERLQMMASSKLPFAAEMLGDATVSPRPTRPQPLLILALALAGGIALGVASAFVPGLAPRR